MLGTHRSIRVVCLNEFEGLTECLLLTDSDTRSVYINKHGYPVISLYCYIHISGVCERRLPTITGKTLYL